MSEQWKSIPRNELAQTTYDILHPMAEIGFQEVNTSAYLAGELEKLGFTVKRNIGTTGILGTLETGVAGPHFGLRADMDALPFEVDGKACAIHACGHDANCSMVLAAATQAVAQGIESGTFHVVFQQAEELTGAIQMAESGELAAVEELVGIHLRPIAEAKLGEVIPVLCTGATYLVTLTIGGISSHGARPHLGVNALRIAVAIVNQMSTLTMDPTAAWSVKPTQMITSGNPKNSLPDTCMLTFDIRCQEDALADQVLEKVKAVANCCAEMEGGTIRKVEVFGVPGAVMDPLLEDVCQKATLRVMGDSLGKRSTSGGEDLHYFRKIAGIRLCHIGVGADIEHGLHHAQMNFDRRALDIGAAVLVALVDERLGLKKIAE